jgi:hypothetical protein
VAALDLRSRPTLADKSRRQGNFALLVCDAPLGDVNRHHCHIRDSERRRHQFHWVYRALISIYGIEL